MSKKSAFTTWFKAQFGRDVMPEPKFEKLLFEVESLRAVLFAKEEELRFETELRAQQTAALYAWQIEDTKKVVREW